jgi:hypothetical protein
MLPKLLTLMDLLMNKVLIMALVSFIMLLSCSQKEEQKEASSEEVVQVKTVDELIEAKKEGKATSEWELCMSKAQKYEDWLASTKSECRSRKLADEGYTDGVDCIDLGMKGICDQRSKSGLRRYDAEVEAYNSCIDEVKNISLPEGIDELSPFDCMRLMGE